MERRNVQATVARDGCEVLADGFSSRATAKGAAKSVICGKVMRSFSSSTISGWRMASMMRSKSGISAPRVDERRGRPKHTRLSSTRR